MLQKMQERRNNMDNLISNNNPNFYWWFGAVEDRNDPLRLGRCKVRILGYHTADLELLPTENLPWAMPVMPANSAGSSGVGWSPTGAVEGSWVVGFFADGENGQHPMFFGTVGSIPGGLASNDCTPEDGSGGANDSAVGSGTGGVKGDFVEPSGNAKDYESYLEQYLEANGPKNLKNWGKMAKAAIMAQCAHESGNFRFFKEIWGPTKAQSGYEGRRDLGNNQPGDGKKYMGRGYIQITGRANYRACGNYISKDLISTPELLQLKEAGAAAVVWFFAKGNARNIGPRNQWGDIEKVTRAVNGGVNGLSDRINKFAHYKKKYGLA
jgi:putative chitinase